MDFPGEQRSEKQLLKLHQCSPSPCLAEPSQEHHFCQASRKSVKRFKKPKVKDKNIHNPAKSRKCAGTGTNTKVLYLTTGGKTTNSMRFQTIWCGSPCTNNTTEMSSSTEKKMRNKQPLCPTARQSTQGLGKRSP